MYYLSSLDVAERLFILGTEIDSRSPKIDHTIMYSKSLFKLKKYEYQFDLL
jgi:hypothetical protein